MTLPLFFIYYKQSFHLKLNSFIDLKYSQLKFNVKSDIAVFFKYEYSY